MTTLSGAPTTMVSFAMSASGAWSADVALEAGKAGPVASCSLVLGDVTFAGGVVRGGVADGTSVWSGYLEGGVGWRRALFPRSYQSDAPGGVRLLTVLRDLAAECGETLRFPADAPIGSAYARPGSTPERPYSGRDALAALRARGLVAPWWVDPAGVTRFDARPGGAARGFEFLRRNMADGSRQLGAVSSVAGILPGLALDGGTISRVYVREGGSLTAEAWL